MTLFKVACLCLLFVSLVCSDEGVTTEEGKETETKDEGFCVSKENCEETSVEDETESSGAKYTEEKQEKTSETSEDETDKLEDDEVKDEEKIEEKPIRKGEEERHLVKIEVLEEGKMCERLKATNDDAVTVHMKGFKSSDGSEFITTYKEDGSEGLSIAFRMGVGESIKGLELGIIGMCIAEKRRLTVPASLVRNGRQEFKGDLIPRGEDLIFEVELLGAVPNYQKGMPNIFKKTDLNGDGVIQREEMYEAIIGDESMFPRGCEIADTLTDEQMTKQDFDKDGVIQWKEFYLPKWDEM